MRISKKYCKRRKYEINKKDIEKQNQRNTKQKRKQIKIRKKRRVKDSIT